MQPGKTDLDRAGDMDLVFANRDGQQNYVYLNEQGAGFEHRRLFGTGSDETRALIVADMNGDGFLDIVADNIGEVNAVYFGNGKGDFDSGVTLGHPDGATFALAVSELPGAARFGRELTGGSTLAVSS